MKFILSFLFIIFSASMTSAQNLSFGLGIELNQTRFRQKAPTVETGFNNPHQAAFGFGFNFLVDFKYADKYTIGFTPGISILRTKSMVTSSKQIHYLNAPIELGYFITKRSQIRLGIQYSYLIKLNSTFKNNTTNLTFFANHRHYLSPTFTFSFELNSNWSIHTRFIYFIQNLFNSGALDVDGNVVGPVMVTPYALGIGFNYKFRVIN